MASLTNRGWGFHPGRTARALARSAARNPAAASRAAQSGAVGAAERLPEAPADGDSTLAELLVRWPDLPQETRQAILAIARGKRPGHSR
jgi:hypothetical protein